jgi:Ser/Thr protein kinase RdoA (MazF antagonist)
MALDDFFALTPERVLGAAEVGGRRATGYVLALNSLENRVYEIELEEGGPDGSNKVVAKFYRPERWSREAILDEHRYLAELAEEELPVVPPLDLDGTTLREMAGSDGSAILYALFPKARGRAPEELQDEQLRQLGRLVARLHLVGERRGATARPALTAASYGAASVRAIVEGPWIPMELAAPFARVGEAIVERCRSAGVDGERAIRLHGDCHKGNLLWGAEGPFFLDFDDFLHGPAVQDLWLLAPGHDDEARAQRALLVEGYGTMRAFDERTLRLVEPLRALRILRYAAWIAQRYRDPAFQRAFPDLEEHAWWRREVQALEEQLRRIEQTA